jgi:hypothetical protein
MNKKRIAKAKDHSIRNPAAKGTLGKKGSTTMPAAKGKGTVKGKFRGSGDGEIRIRRGVQY